MNKPKSVQELAKENVKCPFCHAEKGVPCENLLLRQPRSVVHPGRVEEYHHQSFGHIVSK